MTLKNIKLFLLTLVVILNLFSTLHINLQSTNYNAENINYLPKNSKVYTKKSSVLLYYKACKKDTWDRNIQNTNSLPLSVSVGDIIKCENGKRFLQVVLRVPKLIQNSGFIEFSEIDFEKLNYKVNTEGNGDIVCDQSICYYQNKLISDIILKYPKNQELKEINSLNQNYEKYLTEKNNQKFVDSSLVFNELSIDTFANQVLETTTPTMVQTVVYCTNSNDFNLIKDLDSSNKGKTDKYGRQVIARFESKFNHLYLPAFYKQNYAPKGSDFGIGTRFIEFNITLDDPDNSDFTSFINTEASKKSFKHCFTIDKSRSDTNYKVRVKEDGVLGNFINPKNNNYMGLQYEYAIQIRKLRTFTSSEIKLYDKIISDSVFSIYESNQRQDLLNEINNLKQKSIFNSQNPDQITENPNQQIENADDLSDIVNNNENLLNSINFPDDIKYLEIKDKSPIIAIKNYQNLRWERYFIQELCQDPRKIERYNNDKPINNQIDWLYKGIRQTPSIFEFKSSYIDQNFTKKTYLNKEYNVSPVFTRMLKSNEFGLGDLNSKVRDDHEFYDFYYRFMHKDMPNIYCYYNNDSQLTTSGLINYTNTNFKEEYINYKLNDNIISSGENLNYIDKSLGFINFRFKNLGDIVRAKLEWKFSFKCTSEIECVMDKNIETEIDITKYNYERLKYFGMDGIESPFMVEGYASETGNSIVHNSYQRMLKFNIVSGTNEDKLKYSGDKDVWIVSHGWNGGLRDMNNIAESIAKNNPNSIVMLLDWREASSTTNDLPGNCIAANWIVPTSKEIKQKLSDWGFKNGKRLNLVGHSLGALLSNELGLEYNKVAQTIYLDPPSENSCVGGYNVQEERGIYKKIPRNNLDKGGEINRAMVGKNSVCGNQDLNKTATISAQAEFNAGWDDLTACREHAWVHQLFLIMESTDKLKDNIWTTMDKNKHDDWRRDGDGNEYFDGNQARIFTKTKSHNSKDTINSGDLEKLEYFKYDKDTQTIDKLIYTK
jgi:pimeloyl-ACP methyl ester carboxylesterase